MKGLMMTSLAPCEPDVWDLYCRKQMQGGMIDALTIRSEAAKKASEAAPDLKRSLFLNYDAAQRMRTILDEHGALSALLRYDNAPDRPAKMDFSPAIPPDFSEFERELRKLLADREPQPVIDQLHNLTQQ
jgi:hypothetical protein